MDKTKKFKNNITFYFVSEFFPNWCKSDAMSTPTTVEFNNPSITFS